MPRTPTVVPLPTTIGFEAEFAAGAGDVIRDLATRVQDPATGLRWSGTPDLHRYHCDCSACGNGYAFHGQTDSSCSGEIISTVFNTWEQVKAATQILQDVATDVDAIPGEEAGFHVHIGRPAGAACHNTFFEVMRYEKALRRIAAGRFGVQRANNTSLQDTLRYAITDYIAGPWHTGVPDEHYNEDDRYSFNYIKALEWVRHSADHPLHKERLYAHQRDADRHTNLNIRTRFNTWEFRFWNSTRSAWRMQMWIGLSAAFVDPTFMAHLSTVDAPAQKPDNGVGDIIEALVAADMGATASLVTRQQEYITKATNGTFVIPFEYASF